MLPGSWTRTWLWNYEPLLRNAQTEDLLSHPTGESVTLNAAVFVRMSRSAELLLSIPASKRKALQTSDLTSEYSTSTPSRALSARPSLTFVDQSPVATQVSTQPATQLSAPPIPSRHRHAPQLKTRSEQERAIELNLEVEEQDVLALARTSMEAREFTRVSQILQGCRSSKGRFLNIYSQFIVGAIFLL